VQIAGKPVQQFKKRVKFSAKLKGAKEVVLTGDFTGWVRDKIRLRSAGGEEWYADLQLAPGEYQYRLIVDGQWHDHPEAQKRVPNAFGSQNCVLTVT